MTSPSPRLAIPILFGVVFIDLIGFGILVPLVPFYVQRMGVGPELITLVIALQPLSQSLVTPLWGALSDRIGRRPVLLVSMLGHAGAYVLLAFADSLEMLILSRILSGITSANIATAYAYIADITPPEERAGALGKISAAFGLGFAVGPGLGGLLAGGTSMTDANFVLPAVTAAGFSLLAFLAILIFLKESLPSSKRSKKREAGQPGTLRSLARVAGRPVITVMLMLCVLVITCMSIRESIYSLWLFGRFAFNAQQIGLLMAYAGALVFLIQMFGIGRLAKRFGELNLIKTALVCLTCSWLSLVIAEDIPGLLLAMTFGAFGTAFFQTNMQALMSMRAGPSERGAVLGVYQSSASAARFVGQASSGTLFAQLGQNAPFLVGAAAMLPALLLAWWAGRRIAAEPRPTSLKPG